MKTMNSKVSVPLNRLFLRILLFFLSFLIPIVLIGAIYYVTTTNRLQEEFTQKFETNLQSSVHTIDIYLNTAQSSSGPSFFYEVRAILKPYAEYRDDERLELTKVTQTLARISNNLSELIDNIFVYTDDEKVFKQDGLEDYRQFFENYKFIGYDQNLWRDKLENGRPLEILEPTEVRVNRTVSKPVIPFLFTSLVNGHKAAMVYTIPIDIIDKTLRNHTLVDSTQFIVIDNNHNKVIWSSENQLAEPTVISQIQAFFKSGSLQHGELKINQEAFIVTQVTSETYGWSYYSVTPVAEFRNQTSYYLLSLLTTCFVLVVVGILFSFIFTFNLYNPIKRIRDILDHPEESDERADSTNRHTAFDFIGTRIHRLIEHNHQFKHELETVSVGYLEQSLLNLIHGRTAVNKQEIGTMLSKYSSFHKSSYVCCIIRFDFKEAFYQDIQDVERLHIVSKMKKIIWGLLLPYANIYLLEEHDHLYIGIVNVEDGEDTERLRKGLQTMVDTFHYDSRYCFIYIGIGDMHEGIQGITRSYTDALKALESADGKMDFQIIDATAVSHGSMHYSYSFMDENGIINCLKAGDMSNLRLKVDSIIGKNKEKGVPRHLISALVSEIYNTGCRFLAERGINPSELMEPGKLVSLTNHEEQLNVVLAFFELIMDRFSSQEQNGFSEISSLIIEYIEGNYHHDLGLEKISGEMGVSSKYISHVFKEKTGENLIGYISKYRIAKAKEMLVETDLNISEISNRVGIFSRTTFIRLFKKYEGTTPLLYRNLSRNK